MPKLREYLKETYGPPVGFPPLVRKHKGTSEQAQAMPANSLASVADDTTGSSSPVPVHPEDLCSDAGSKTEEFKEDDTEQEDNTELEDHYLARVASDQRDVGTVFGKGIRVWKSYQGTLYTHIQGEIVDGEVVIPRKRTRERTQRTRRPQRSAASFLEQHDKPSGNILVQQSIHVSEQRSHSSTTSILAPGSFTLPARPAPPPAPVTELRARNPAQVSTIFHHGSAAINPLGAYIHPVPHVHKTPQAAPVTPPQEKPRQIVSGSFGTFDGAPGRFDERPYLLLPGGTMDGRAHGKRDGRGMDERPGMAFRARPWLKR
ncbi:uncharacterized protein M421DRAFT_395141 [Didymella exigua CBS 183.55]|uniref:Uncharacterized protein n=1 Tax=Didymella exigua CBS 183.55 TaxID=1150837 RepID=A0A6A5RXQ6_9PLEO|nr:uncharacterized protein M421DRAFT_395141 [Didymella exigua CBS 183.55]KAF1933181.1 hypothetical protein M421DRAFT_395141 [Didymella exigua CBS 183.55]